MKRRLLKSVPTLTAAEVAAELGVTDAAVRKARKNGRLLAVEFGGRQRMDDPDRGDGDPPWFGPAPGERPGGRFGDPLRTLAATVPTFGRCYLGVSHEAAFAVSFLRRPPLAAIDRATVDGRDMAEIVITRPLRLVALLGPGLKAAGATAAVSTGPSPPPYAGGARSGSTPPPPTVSPIAAGTRSPRAPSPCSTGPVSHSGWSDPASCGMTARGSVRPWTAI